MFGLSILPACSPTWTHIANQIPVSSNYTESTPLNVNLANCQTECQTEAACIGIALTDNGGFDAVFMLFSFSICIVIIAVSLATAHFLRADITVCLMSLFTACYTKWTVTTGQIPNRLGDVVPVLNVNLDGCKNMCETDAACIGIALTDNGPFGGLDCRLLDDATYVTDTKNNSKTDIYEITRCQEQTEGDTWFQRYITHARPAL